MPDTSRGQLSRSGSPGSTARETNDRLWLNLEVPWPPLGTTGNGASFSLPLAPTKAR